MENVALFHSITYENVNLFQLLCQYAVLNGSSHLLTLKQHPTMTLQEAKLVSRAHVNPFILLSSGCKGRDRRHTILTFRVLLVKRPRGGFSSATVRYQG